MTSEDRENEIKDYVEYLDALYDEVFTSIARESVFVSALGFSQGTSTVARWAGVGRAHMDQVVLWAGSVPPELSREQASRLFTETAPLILVAGTQDKFITGKVLDSQMSALLKLGLSPEVIRFEGGHEVEPATLADVAAKISRRYTSQT